MGEHLKGVGEHLKGVGEHKQGVVNTKRVWVNTKRVWVNTKRVWGNINLTSIAYKYLYYIYTIYHLQYVFLFIYRTVTQIIIYFVEHSISWYPTLQLLNLQIFIKDFVDYHMVKI